MAVESTARSAIAPYHALRLTRATHGRDGSLNRPQGLGGPRSVVAAGVNVA